MSTPQAKRRRLNDAAKTLQKPFKSPFRTPLRPGIDSDSSSDPPDASLLTPVSTNSTLSIDKNQCQSINSPAFSHEPLPLPVASQSRVLRPVSSRPKHFMSTRYAPDRSQSKPSLTREIVQLRNEIQMLTQAHALALSTKDEDLTALIDKWRTASRAAAEELFGTTRDRVNRMGGVGAWKEREKESKERQLKWDREEMEAERDRIEEAKESGKISDEAYEKYADLAEEKGEVESETFQTADDDSFTMDMMLKTLNIDLDLLGYNKEAQRWEG